MLVHTNSFDLRAVGELLDGVTVFRVVLQQDGHLEGRGLQCVPGNNNINSVQTFFMLSYN